MRKIIWISVFIFSFHYLFSQVKTFVVVDDDTMELIGEVNFKLFYNKNPVFKGVTSIDTSTTIQNIKYDSLFFYKKNYTSKGFKIKDFKDAVFLNKLVFELNEIVVVGTKDSLFTLGEKSRFIKRKARPLNKDDDNGIVCRFDDDSSLLLNKVTFYVDKAKYRTTYKVRLYKIDEVGWPLSKIKFNELLFESPIQTIKKGDKGKVQVDLSEFNITLKNKILVSIVLENHYSRNGDAIIPEITKRTKIKFQFSKENDYYSKSVDLYTNKISKDLININQMMLNDMADGYVKNLHKSSFVAPAILLTVKSSNEINVPQEKFKG